MPRAIWKGSVSFGLVTIPVSLYPSDESAEAIGFRQLHRPDLAPIQYRRVCSAEGTEVPWGEIAKGYEYAKGQFVVITDGDLAKARVEATQTIDVRDFVPAADIPWTFFENAYYVEPAKAGFRAYALLREALKESGRVGIGSVVLRQREHLAALAPSGDVLVLAMMKFAHELRSPDALTVPRDVPVDPRELQLARQLIDTLAADWKPDQYRDSYTDAIRRVIEQKVEGKEITAPELKPRGEVRDLMEALRRSLEERAGKKPSAKETPARAETPAKKRMAREESAARKSAKRARSA
jgi:DNA end-binding protein Ku